MRVLTRIGIMARAPFWRILYVLVLLALVATGKWWWMPFALWMGWMLYHVPNPPFRKWYCRWEDMHPGKGIGIYVQKREVCYYYLFWNSRVFIAYFG